MVKQTLPDEFYALLFMAVLLLLITERVWQLLIILLDTTPDRRVNQRRRYGAALLGLANSAVAIGLLVFNYSLHEIRIGLNELHPIAGGTPYWAGWAIIVVHLITIAAMPFFMLRFYLKPSPYKTYGSSYRPARSRGRTRR